MAYDYSGDEMIHTLLLEYIQFNKYINSSEAGFYLSISLYISPYISISIEVLM